MKQQFRKTMAAIASGAMLCAGMPLLPVCAEELVEEPTAVVTLAGDHASYTGKNVTIDGSHITITASGSYLFSGTLADGMIEVAVADETVDAGTVKLLLNGVSITGVSDAAIYVSNAEKTSIQLMADTENYIADGAVYTDTTAAIFAKDDLTIKGEGALTITATTQYGIHCNNDLKITGGNIRIDTELEDAIRGKTSVEIKGGTLNINAEGDGIKSTKGDVLISDGIIEVKAGNDAVQGETSLQITGGTLLANGDRSLTCATAAPVIDGGTILATACDLQPATLIANQPVLLLNGAAEWTKDQVVTLSNGETTCLSLKPDKKFTYALLSAPGLTVGGSYSIAIGDTPLTHTTADGTQTAFVLTDAQTVFDAVASSAPTILLGDVNLDGQCTMEDAVLLARYVTESQSTTIAPEGLLRMDCNQDGLVTIADATAILALLATPAV